MRCGNGTGISEWPRWKLATVVSSEFSSEFFVLYSKLFEFAQHIVHSVGNIFISPLPKNILCCLILKNTALCWMLHGAKLTNLKNAIANLKNVRVHTDTQIQNTYTY